MQAFERNDYKAKVGITENGRKEKDHGFAKISKITVRNEGIWS